VITDPTLVGTIAVASPFLLLAIVLGPSVALRHRRNRRINARFASPDSLRGSDSPGRATAGQGDLVHRSRRGGDGDRPSAGPAPTTLSAFPAGESPASHGPPGAVSAGRGLAARRVAGPALARSSVSMLRIPGTEASDQGGAL
jgi:hypothetical protein